MGPSFHLRLHRLILNISHFFAYENSDLERRLLQTPGEHMQALSDAVTGFCVPFCSARMQDIVILGADTRVLEGPIVADKNCEKFHFMAPNIYHCGAGTAAETEADTDMVNSQLKLHRYHTGRESKVATTLSLLKDHMFNYQGHISVALVLGGVDVPIKCGFNFDMCKRNEMLANKVLKPSSFLKTGTTIVGLVYPDGVILGADTRAPEGPIVADRNCEAYCPQWNWLCLAASTSTFVVLIF